MALPASLKPMIDWLQANGVPSPELAGMVLGAAGIVCAVAILWICRLVLRLVFVAVSSMSASARARKVQPGYRILVSPPARSGRSAHSFLMDAAGEHMSTFSFDAPLQVFKTARIVGGRDARSERAARRRLKRAGADLIIWGERVGRGEEGLNIFTLSRAGGLTPDEAVLEHFSLPSASKHRGEDVRKVAAYLLAKRLQPSLGRPSDFRAERLEPVAAQLSELLDAGRSYLREFKMN